ncbi:MAG: TolC family protein [Cetobacterium sp.]
MRRKGLTLGIGLIVSGIIYSQEMGLEDILKRAETSNSEVKISELNSAIKKKGKDKALKNLILPPVNLSTEEEWGIVKDEGFGFKEIEAYIPLFQGGKVYNGYKKSKVDYDLANKEERLSIFSAQERAVGEYFKALNYREQYEITQGAIEALEKQRGRLEGMYRTGKLVPKSEVLKIEADIENNRAINMENRQREKNSLETLYKLLDYPLDSNITLKKFQGEEYLKGLVQVEKPTDNPEDTTLGAVEKLRVEKAEYDMKIAKGDLYPTLYVKPSHKFKEKRNGRLETVNEGMVEVGFRYVFEWGGTLDGVKQKEYALDQAKIRYKDNINGISLEMRNKYREIEALYGQSLASKKRVDLLNENLEIDNLRYDNELISTFDYLNSVNELRTAKENYYKIQRQLVLTIIEYRNLYK